MKSVRFMFWIGWLVTMNIQYCLAGQRMAILDFELKDITSLPNTPAELTRTASIKTLLEQAVSRQGQYDIVQIPETAVQRENAGFGYLFQHDEVAVALAKTYGVDWIIVGQHSKPSFLFSYLMVHLINVHHPDQVADFDIELKGNHTEVTIRAASAMAKKIDSFIQK